MSTDIDVGWAVHPRVAVRPESFGALLYHFGTRRLTFLKDRRLLTVVNGLDDHPTARDAIAAAGIDASDVPRFAAALQRLVDIDMLVCDPADESGRVTEEVAP